jgi:hypothetical protein
MDELLYSSNNWAVLYHCSDIRHNLLEWYPFEKDGTLLEIGSGCGALSGLFAQKVKEVTCIELSERRSLINAYRNQEYDNIKIILGNFQDIIIDKKYDYISLIGVWEYSAQYINGNNPYLQMLKKIKEYLNEDGKILIGIENKMGLKYWNGAVEDHTSKMYSGLNDYFDSNNVRTFSKPEIEQLFSEAGINNYTFYYPSPDYKLPEVIYSDEKLPSVGNIRNYRKDYNACRVYNFNEATVADQLSNDDMFPYFSNSFLVVVGESRPKCKYAKYNRQRVIDKRISTRIEEINGEKFVVKKALNDDSKEHIRHIGENAGKCKESFPNIIFLQGRMEGDTYVIPYIEGVDLETEFYQYRNDSHLFVNNIKKMCSKVFCPNKSLLKMFEYTEQYKKVFGSCYPLQSYTLPYTNVDMIWSNLRKTVDGKIYCFDSEWVFDFPVPFEYVIWRGISQLYGTYRIYLKNQLSYEQFINEIGIEEDKVLIYKKMEACFSDYVYGDNGSELYLNKFRKPTMMQNIKFS